MTTTLQADEIQTTEASGGPQVLQTSCTLDCPDSCSLDVTVEDGRVTRVDGNHRNPLTQGFICSKVHGIARHLYGEERLLSPAVRRGPKGSGDFEAVSWDDALERIAENLRTTRDRWGGEAILPFAYGGSNGHLSDGSTDERLFRRLGALRLARTVCAAPSSAAASAMYGKFPGTAPEDYVHSRLIIVWGANPSAAGIHLVPLIREAQKQGAKLVVVDPRRIPLAKQADLHLAVRPGTDLPVALSLIRWFFDTGRADLEFLDQHALGVDELRRRAEPWTFERAAEVAGLDAADLETLAQLYADTDPAVMRCGWGGERNRNGGSAIAAILALPAVAGKFGVRGGGFTMSNSGAWGLGSDDLVNAPEAQTRTVNMNRLGRELLDGHVRHLFVYNANPLMTLPDQVRVRRGLERDDLFTVVFDQVMTDTARYADVILPATTFLEHHDLRAGYGSMALQTTVPVAPAAGEAKPNFEVFAELCRRLDLEQPDDIVDQAAYTAALLETAGHGKGAGGKGGSDPQRVASSMADDGLAFPDSGGTPLQFVEVFPWTASGKIDLVPESLDREAPEGLYHFQPDPAATIPANDGGQAPLALISPATSRTVSSTLGQLYRKPAALEMHPDDAAARGLAKGDRVRIWNDLGEVHCRLRITKDMRPGVATLAKGLWSHNTENGLTSNALVPDTYTDIAGGACFNDARVWVERLA